MERPPRQLTVRTRTLGGPRGRPVAGSAPQLFGPPEEQGHPQGGAHESRREPDKGEAVVLRHPPEDRQGGAQRARDEGDDSREARLADAHTEEKPVQREPERDCSAHVHRVEDSVEVGGVYESEEKAQRRPQHGGTERGRERQARESEVRTQARAEASAIAPHEPTPNHETGAKPADADKRD